MYFTFLVVFPRICTSIQQLDLLQLWVCRLSSAASTCNCDFIHFVYCMQAAHRPVASTNFLVMPLTLCCQVLVVDQACTDALV